MDEEWMRSQISDIGHDTDALIKMLGSESVGESFDSGLITGMLQKQGIDPGIVAMLKDNDGLGGGNGMWLLILFLLILGRGGLGFGGDGNMAKESTLIDQSNYNSLMNAITSTGARQEVAIGDLATSIGCSVGDIKLALASMDKQIAVTEGNIQKAISDCCCRTNLNIERSQNALSSQIAAQTNGMNLSFSAQNQLIQQQTQTILDRMSQYQLETNSNFCDLRNREDARQIADLQQKLADAKATANTQAILSAIQNKDTIAYSGTITGSTVAGTGTLS